MGKPLIPRGPWDEEDPEPKYPAKSNVGLGIIRCFHDGLGIGRPIFWYLVGQKTAD